jgi:hypothetical protein
MYCTFKLSTANGLKLTISERQSSVSASERASSSAIRLSRILVKNVIYRYFSLFFFWGGGIPRLVREQQKKYRGYKIIQEALLFLFYSLNPDPRPGFQLQKCKTNQVITNCFFLFGQTLQQLSYQASTKDF